MKRKMVHSAKKIKHIQSLTMASPEIKKFNRRELEEACRKLNANRSDKHGEKRPRAPHFESDAQASGIGAENQVKSLDIGVKICARKYNECKARADRLDEDLAKKRDEVNELQREASVLEEMIKGRNTEAKKITQLNKDIVDANAISESKMKYRLQLNHMYQRQRNNTISFDAHMSEMSSALSAAEKEKDRCLKMLGEIESGVTRALHDLHTTKHELNVKRSKRDESLNNKKTEVANAKRLEQWRNEQEINRRGFEQSIGGAFQLEKENRINLIREREAELKKLIRDNEEKSTGQRSSEEAFIHIKRATGVNNLEEMVDKLTNYQEQRSRLQNERKDAEDRLKASKLMLSQKQIEFDSLKANGPGEDLEFHRDKMKDTKIKIKYEQAEVKVLRSSNTRLEGVLVGLRQGGLGLYQRILPFHFSLLDCDPPSLKESTSVVDDANSTLEMLRTAQQVISKMVDVIGGMDKVTKPNKQKVLQVRQENVERLENPNLGENNCRIQPKVSSPSTPQHDFDEDNFDNDAVDWDKTVMSRTALKSQSEKQAGDARKHQEIKRREQKKNSEKFSNDGTGTFEAKKLQEQNSISRLSKHTLPKGLPRSVNMRDDPLKKAQAFVQENPIID